MSGGARSGSGSAKNIELSVVIPTFNRKERLIRVLDALASQTITDAPGVQPDAGPSFEVIVVSDGSTDGTQEAMADAAARAPFPLQFIEQPNRGPGAARNTGVEASRARLVCFIDDDVIPEPECLAAHLARQADREDLVVIGPMLTPTDIDQSPVVAWEQHQLEKQYRRFETNPEAHHRQFYTGNASLPREALRRVGGFDPSLRRAEDVELAHRLNLEGLSFVFESRARAFHHAERSFDSWRQMAYDYGRINVAFSTTGQPHVREQIRGFFYQRNPLQRLLVRASVRSARLSRFVEVGLRRVVGLARWQRAQPIGRQALSAIYGMRYYQGVTDELGGSDLFAELIAGQGPPDRISVWILLDQTHGSVAQSENLGALDPEIDGVVTEFVALDESANRAGASGRRELKRREENKFLSRPDVTIVHSQEVPVLLGRWMGRNPTVLSLDLEPLRQAKEGGSTGRRLGSRASRPLVSWLNRRCCARASHLITSSSWAKQHVIEHLGVDPAKVTVVASDDARENALRILDVLRDVAAARGRPRAGEAATC